MIFMAVPVSIKCFIQRALSLSHYDPLARLSQTHYEIWKY